ncbi:MAG TPA: histidine kinase [Nocardioides sp.]|uniref:histidine kinase n=1 Tax=Nocardioides sp. TaxID=35761 RepID=UPI002F426DE5
MTRRRWAALGVVVLGLGWGLGGEAVSIAHHVDENHLLDFATGFSFFLGGAVAVDRRPGNRLGPLMVLNGVSWFCGNWMNIPNGWSLEFLHLGEAAAAGLLAHLVVAYPSGRLTTRFERAVVLAAYVVPTGAMALSLLTQDTSRCPACPAVPAALPDLPDAALAHRFFLVYDRSAWVLVPLFFAVLWLRWHRSSPAARRDLAPLWAVACILVVVFSLSPFTSSESGGFAYLIWELNAVLNTAVPWIFVYGLLSTRLAQSAIGGLVVDLQSPVAPGQLRALLARTLADPAVQVAYPMGGDRWVDADGRPADPHAPYSGRRTTMVERHGHPLAALVHDVALDPDLVRATAAAAGMALDNERLHAELRAQLEEVRASRERIVLAGDAERRRVERDLHDGAQQRLLALSLALRTARRQLGNGEQSLVADTLERTGQELATAIDELRELARGIHPTVLTDAGLGPAVAMVAGRVPVPVDVAVGDERYPPPVEATAYFVVSEALANVTKHSHATHAGVAVARVGDHLHVEVCDDGRGGADPGRGSGLAGLRDRVIAVGGTLSFESEPGAGTVVRVDLPCQDAP